VIHIIIGASMLIKYVDYGDDEKHDHDLLRNGLLNTKSYLVVPVAKIFIWFRQMTEIVIAVDLHQ